ncbi:hypothetical protein [Desulfosporosinus sp. FKA]|uniref:hypothetical protein n=1 Tax=Desulfosporosinus sp. FKA TaxID=1969834 RepID=UPI0015579714|nr:hypothetical protein [Desulfosporosinus sp. FKA]
MPLFGAAFFHSHGDVLSAFGRMNDCLGQAASPTPFTQHSEARPLGRAGAPPNLWAVPDVNHWLRCPAQPLWALPPLHAMSSLLWAKLPCLEVYKSIVFSG